LRCGPALFVKRLNMGFLRQRWADVSGHRTTNGTLVDSFIRTDSNGPVWQLRCSCGRLFTIAHSRIAAALQSGAPVHCDKCCIPTGDDTTTLASIRKAERLQREAQEREQAERQRLTAIDAQKEAEARVAKRRYLPFAHAQIRAGVPVDSANFVTFERFQAWPKHSQEDTLKKVGGRFC
jgi:hypothetical protein